MLKVTDYSDGTKDSMRKSHCEVVYSTYIIKVTVALLAFIIYYFQPKKASHSEVSNFTHSQAGRIYKPPLTCVPYCYT